jgi:hypothetical protein
MASNNTLVTNLDANFLAVIPTTTQIWDQSWPLKTTFDVLNAVKTMHPTIFDANFWIDFGVMEEDTRTREFLNSRLVSKQK